MAGANAVLYGICITDSSNTPLICEYNQRPVLGGFRVVYRNFARGGEFGVWKKEGGGEEADNSIVVLCEAQGGATPYTSYHKLFSCLSLV